MPFYNLTNFITKENYLFIPLETEIKKKLSPSDIDTLHKTHKIPKKIVSSSKHIFNYDIQNYSIRDLKKLIFVLIGIPFEKQHLWVENKTPSIDIVNDIIRRHKYNDIDLDTKLFANFPQTLGYIYKGEEGINYYNPNLLELDYDTITKDPSDLYIDLHSEIIGDYDNIDNTIYFIDF